MTRPLRLEYPGAVYHITSRGNNKTLIFDSSYDKQDFLDIMRSVFSRYIWLCHAYCLMDNHYHLVIETPNGNLSRGMRQLNGIWARRYNHKHKRVGHVFQARYFARLIEKENYLLEVVRYTILNPNRAGIVEYPDDYPFSSFRRMLNNSSSDNLICKTFVLDQFGKNQQSAKKAFWQFIYDGIDAESPFENIKASIFLGSDKFVAEHTLNLADEKLTEIPKLQRPDPKPRIGNLIKNKKDREGIYSAYRDWGYTMKAISDYLEVHYSTVSRTIKNHELLVDKNMLDCKT